MYRILRNNKEQGPYSLDELLLLSLRPYDLVWVEGKSASWRYPYEIEDIKPFLNSSQIPANLSQSLSLPIALKVAPTEMTTNAKGVETEELELTADMLEQKANAIYQRIQAYNAKCEQEGKDVQIKYARSLDDLKQDYADWLHGKKHKRREINSSNKGWIAFGAVSAAFIIFVLAGKDKDIEWPTQFQNDDTKSKAVKIVYDENEAKSSAAINSNPTDTDLPEKQLTSIQTFIDSVRTALRNHKATINTKSKVSKASGKKIVDSQVSNHPVEVILPPVEEKIASPSIKAADLDARYIPSENSTRIKEIHVTVQNTGTVALKQVTVDVFYYKKGDRLVDKETLHFNDIGPGNAYTVTKLGNKKANSARFELGEVIADN
jgi:hypothetical protein